MTDDKEKESKILMPPEDERRIVIPGEEFAKRRTEATAEITRPIRGLNIKDLTKGQLIKLVHEFKGQLNLVARERNAALAMAQNAQKQSDFLFKIVVAVIDLDPQKHIAVPNAAANRDITGMELKIHDDEAGANAIIEYLTKPETPTGDDHARGPEGGEQEAPEATPTSRD